MNLLAVIMISAGMFPLFYAIRRLRFASIFLSAVMGISSLFAADIILGFTRIDVPINCCSVLCAAIGGIPGTILLLLLMVLLASG